MRCCHCSKAIELDERSEKWIHLTNRFRCDGAWFEHGAPGRLAEPDYFNAYLEAILDSSDTRSEESLSQRRQ